MCIQGVYSYQRYARITVLRDAKTTSTARRASRPHLGGDIIPRSRVPVKRLCIFVGNMQGAARRAAMRRTAAVWAVALAPGTACGGTTGRSTGRSTGCS